MTMTPQEGVPAAQEEIDALDAEIARLRRELRAAESNRSEALCRPWGIEIGQLVRSTSKRDAGKLGKIASYDTPFTRTMRPWVQVKVQNKNGSFGNRVVNFYGDWERVEDAASDAA